MTYSTDAVMPFGKYKGEPIKTLALGKERSYLVWLRDNVQLKPELKRVINLNLK